MEATDRLAALLRQAAVELDRKAAHALLDAALDHAAGARDADNRDGLLAQAAAIALSTAVAGWAVPVVRSPKEWALIAKEDPVRWREDAIACMRTGYGVVPQPVVDELMWALDTLDTNMPRPAILCAVTLKNLRGKGYGRSPATRHAVEQTLILYLDIAREEGRLNIAQGTIPASPKTIDGWLREWRKRAGVEHVARVRDMARKLGRGEPLDSALPEEFVLLQIVGLDVARFVQLWRSAKDKRRRAD